MFSSFRSEGIEMTGNPENPDVARADPRPSAADVDRPRSGPVAELALVAAGLGVVVYLLAFVDDVGPRSSLIVPLLLGGGLLAGSVALPTVRAGVLVPSAVAAVTGALLLLQDTAGGTSSVVGIGALVLALLEAAAAGGAALLHAGVLRGRPRAKKAAAPPAGYPQQPGYPAFPGQQYPGQPFPGSYAGHPAEPYAGDQYAGEHAYAQYARYGTPYGVPGYPPPPPYGAPGYDQAAALHGVPERPPTPASGIPVAELPTAVTSTGGHRPVAPAPGDPAGTDTGATAVLRSVKERAAEPENRTESHTAVPGGAADGRTTGDDDRTTAVPRAPDER